MLSFLHAGIKLIDVNRKGPQWLIVQAFLGMCLLYTLMKT